MKQHTCGGACCRRFILPYPPEKIKEQYEAWLVGGSDRNRVMMRKYVSDAEMGPMDYIETTPVDSEIYLIYPMLIFLGEFHYDSCNPKRRYKHTSYHYTCKHYDKKTTLCTIYEHRPLMCRRYPNGQPCPFPGCKLPGNKAKLAKQRREREKAKKERKQVRRAKEWVRCDIAQEVCEPESTLKRRVRKKKND